MHRNSEELILFWLKYITSFILNRDDRNADFVIWSLIRVKCFFWQIKVLKIFFRSE